MDAPPKRSAGKQLSTATGHDYNRTMETNPHQSPSAPEPRPAWVKFGLWGLPNRGAAWACFWLSVALSLVGAYGFVDRRFFGFGALVFAALWYWLAIRWVDEHGGWS